MSTPPSSAIVVLFRGAQDVRGAQDALDEINACEEHFPTITSRMDVPENSLVIGRYSVLPYYAELEQDLARVGSRLINSHADHKWIAEMSWAFGPLDGLTPRTWTNWVNLPKDKSFVVKGRTNSRKHQWATHMFAPSAEDIPKVAMRLLDDPLIQEQGLVVREYTALKKLGESINGLPVTNEWRTFWLSVDGRLTCVGRGFYWTASHPELVGDAVWMDSAETIARAAAEIVAAAGPRFFVLDVAQTEEGSWIVVEVNDAQMSGLCGVPAQDLYAGLVSALFG